MSQNYAVVSYCLYKFGRFYRGYPTKTKLLNAIKRIPKAKRHAFKIKKRFTFTLAE